MEILGKVREHVQGKEDTW